jgi:hypothetical protein
VRLLTVAPVALAGCYLTLSFRLLVAGDRFAGVDHLLEGCPTFVASDKRMCPAGRRRYWISQRAAQGLPLAAC